MWFLSKCILTITNGNAWAVSLIVSRLLISCEQRRKPADIQPHYFGTVIRGHHLWLEPHIIQCTANAVSTAPRHIHTDAKLIACWNPDQRQRWTITWTSVNKVASGEQLEPHFHSLLQYLNSISPQPPAGRCCTTDATANLLWRECDREEAYGSHNRLFLRPWWPTGKWFTENQVDAVQTLCQRGTFQGRAVVNLFQSVSISFPAYLGHCWNKFTHNFQTWNWSFLVRLLTQGSLKIVWGCCLQACLAVFDLAPDPYTL